MIDSEVQVELDKQQAEIDSLRTLALSTDSDLQLIAQDVIRLQQAAPPEPLPTQAELEAQHEAAEAQAEVSGEPVGG